MGFLITKLISANVISELDSLALSLRLVGEVSHDRQVEMGGGGC